MTMRVRSYDESMQFTCAKEGLKSLHMICASDMRGVLHSLILALGTYKRGENLSVSDVTKLQRTLYLYGALYRNMYMVDHTELEINVSSMQRRGASCEETLVLL